jgi:hypothetical protein
VGTLAEVETQTAQPFDRALIVSPKGVARLWAREARLWGYDPTELQNASNLEVAATFRTTKSGMIILNDDKVAPNVELMRRWLSGGAFIYDELHRVANHRSRRSRSVRRLAWGARFFRGLTGTPSQNQAAGLWGQMTCVDSNLWGTSWNRWANRYLIRDTVFPSKVLHVNYPEELQEMVLRGASVLRRADVFGPDTWDTLRREVPLSGPVMARYKRLAKEWVINAEGDTVPHLLTRILRLQELTSGYLPTTEGEAEIGIHTAKLDACLDDLEEVVSSGEKAVIVHRFSWEGRQMFEKLATRFGPIPIFAYNGQTSGARRAEIEDEFEKVEGPAVVVMQIQTGGLGISLAKANYVFFLSTTFSHTEVEQARDRIYEPGGAKSVTYYVAPGTVDEYILETIDRKEEMHTNLMNVDREALVFGSAAPRRKLYAG